MPKLQIKDISNKTKQKLPASLTTNRLLTNLSNLESNDHFWNLFDNQITGGIVLKALEGSNDFIIIGFNEQAEKIEGIERETIIGKRLSVAIPHINNSELFALIEQVDKTGGTVKRRVSLKKDSQNIIHRENFIFKLATGEVVILFNDLTKPKQMEAALSERIKGLRFLCNISLLKEECSKDLDQFIDKMINLIPVSWQYPDITASRIMLNDKTYQTDNFRVTDWMLSTNIEIHGEKIGKVEVFYLEEKPEMCEGPFLYEEIVLINIFAREMGKYVDHFIAEEKIRGFLNELEEERKVLRDKNIALREVMHQINSEKEQMALQIQSNISKVAIPMLNRLEQKVSIGDKAYIDLLKKTLVEVTEPIISSQDINLSKLTPRELEICNMIKNGMNTKDMAELLNVSTETVRSQRKNIRVKFGLTNQKTNLATFLYSR